MDKIKKYKCPRQKCDGYMVKRSGMYGDFYGCSNYPHCHHIMKSLKSELEMEADRILMNRGYDPERCL